MTMAAGMVAGMVALEAVGVTVAGMEVTGDVEGAEGFIAGRGRGRLSGGSDGVDLVFLNMSTQNWVTCLDCRLRLLGIISLYLCKT